jgi:hypothetical protein
LRLRKPPQSAAHDEVNMKYVIASLVFIGLAMAISVADAKCYKGKRWIDGLTRDECVAINGKWSDARYWPKRDKQDVTRPH